MARLSGRQRSNPVTNSLPHRGDPTVSVARSTTPLTSQGRGCHRQTSNGRPCALLSTAAAPQPSTVRGCPVPVDSSNSINHRIKLAAQWSDVAKIVDELGDAAGPGNVAYALYRLGCLYSFMSMQRRAALEASGVMPRLLDLARAKLAALSTADAALVLDGCARLGLQPSAAFLDDLADMLAENAGTLQPAQVPLVFWAFATLSHRPAGAVLSLLEAQVRHTASKLTAQGVSLVLSSCQILGHQPVRATLASLGAAMRAGLPAYKRSELAACLEAFKACAFHPGADLLQAIAERAGVQVTPATAQKPQENVASNAVLAPSQALMGAAAADRFQQVQKAGGMLASVAVGMELATQQAKPRKRGGLVKGLTTELSKAAPRALGGNIEDWLVELGGHRRPELCPAVARSGIQVLQPQPPQQAAGYWRFNNGPAVRTSQGSV